VAESSACHQKKTGAAREEAETKNAAPIPAYESRFGNGKATAFGWKMKRA
jgi:hypothetical protein